MTGDTECFVADVAECFVGAFLVVLSACHSPNLPHVPLHSCKWSNVIPMSISLQLAWASPSHRWLLLPGVGLHFFTVGASVGVGVGGIGQSFLILNKFLGADLVFGQGEPCLTGVLGMSSIGGGLEPWTEGCPSFWCLAVGYGTSADFPAANLYTITSMDAVAADLVTGIWVEVVGTMGVGAVGVEVEGIGWASPLTLYLLLASMVLLVTCLGSWGFSSHGVGVLGVGTGAWLVMAGVGAWVWDQAFPLVPNMFSSFRWRRGKDRALYSKGSCFMIYDVLSLWNVWMPCIVFTLPSTSTISTGNRYLKYPLRKLHSGLNIQAIQKISFIFISEF